MLQPEPTASHPAVAIAASLVTALWLSWRPWNPVEESPASGQEAITHDLECVAELGQAARQAREIEGLKRLIQLLICLLLASVLGLLLLLDLFVLGGRILIGRLFRRRAVPGLEIRPPPPGARRALTLQGHGWVDHSG